MSVTYFLTLSCLGDGDNRVTEYRRQDILAVKESLPKNKNSSFTLTHVLPNMYDYCLQVAVLAKRKMYEIF